MSKLLFDLGQVVGTPGALELLNEIHVSAISLLRRHQSGDWGDVDKDDAKSNVEALKDGDRIFSVYKFEEHTFWVITEADRASTCILLPEEY